MNSDDLLYIDHMAEFAFRAHAKVSRIALEQFLEDDTLCLAVAHLLQNLGEAARRISQEFRGSTARFLGRT